MKKSLSGIVISLILITTFSIQDIASAALLRAIQQKAPLTLSQLERFIKSTPDSAIATEIKRRGLAFQLTANQFARLKQLGAGLETIQELQRRLKRPDKLPVKAPPKVEPDSNKVIILVANFDGPNPQEYRVTEHIIGQLKAATKKYSDIEIQPLAQSISELQGGSEVARDIGTKRKASIVLWGWYAANVDAGTIHTYFEVLQKPRGLYLNQNIEKQTATISELRGFKIQIKLSGEIAYLTLLTVGLARYESRDYDGAIDRFTTAIKQSDVPDQMVSPADIYFYRGNAHHNKAGVNEIDNAIADYDNAIKLKPDLADAYNNRGVAYNDKGDYDRAIADYDNAIKFEPDDASAYYNRGITYNNKGDYDRAIADYSNAIKFEPDDASAYYNRGIAYKNKGDYDRAIADYDNAIKLKPNLASAYYNRGNAYNDKGDYDRAIADYSNAIKFKPDDAEAYNNRGVAYASKGEHDRAIADFNQAIKLRPGDANAYCGRAAIYKFKGERKRAIADFNHVLKITKDSKLRQVAQQELQELGVK